MKMIYFKSTNLLLRVLTVYLNRENLSFFLFSMNSLYHNIYFIDQLLSILKTLLDQTKRK